MRKKLDTRFLAARIKKIMQADEDVGKIALAVPVLVSRALELFLKDLCDCTYEITLQRGAKTMSSLHLKHCSYNSFDFLREIVSKVPDYSHGHSDQSVDHRSLQKRKPAGEDVNDSDEESKRSRMQETGLAGSSGRGRGRGRGWGRGRGSKSLERESSLREIEVQHTMIPQHIVINSSIPGAVSNETAEMKESPKENSTAADTNNPPQRKFDLNAEVCYEDVKTTTDPAGAAASAAVSSSADAQAPEPKPEEYPGWSLLDMDKMAIDPVQIAQLGAIRDEDEDYDEEG